MSPKLYCAIPNSYVVNGATGLKGKYVKIISVNDWNGSIINVKVSNYGNGSYFYIILCLATNNISRWASGKLIAGNISGFSFYRVDKSIYMFIPDSIQDLYVTLDASMGNVSYGEEYENTIDLSNPITISWHNSLSTLDLGELIGVANAEKNGLMSVEDKKRLGRRFFKGYTKLVESKYWYNHYVALIFGASPASNLGSLIAIDWKGNELISVTRFFGNNDNVKLYLGSNPETNMYELWLGLIGLDGDGSEFIIQSRESIDLDSKTVETLPSYLKVISISWQKNNDFSELGELIGINDTWIRRRFAIKDCNTAIAGAYNVDDSTTNNFPTGAYKFGTLLVANSGFFGSQYFVPDNFNADPYIYIRSIGNDGTTFNKWAKIKVTIIT